MKHAPSLPRNQSLERGIQLLRALAERPQGSNASSLARVTGLPRPTTGRLLATLADAGLVERLADGDGWVLGREILRLGRAADPYRHVLRQAEPLLERLAEETGESAMIGTAGPESVEVLAQADNPHLVGVTNWVGRSLKRVTHASAAGKLYLATLSGPELDAWIMEHPLEKLTERTIVDARALKAELAKVRRLDAASTVDELEDGLCTVAVPLNRAVPPDVLALAVSGPTFRLTAPRRKGLVPVLHEAARRLNSPGPTP